MNYNFTLAACLAVVMISLPLAGSAQDIVPPLAPPAAAEPLPAPAPPEPDLPRGERLLRDLAKAENDAAAHRLERQLINEWSKSGSPAMDLLLKRGRDALAVSDHAAALEHFRALTDHAPDFAEGWHGLALAYFQTEKFGPAMAALEQVLALNPSHFGALRGVGAIQEQIGQSTLAYEAFEQVLRLRPHDEDVLRALERLEREVRGVAL